ncbi:hypothetical protein Tco_0391226 [Tanacetum coccineum]
MNSDHPNSPAPAPMGSVQMCPLTAPQALRLLSASRPTGSDAPVPPGSPFPSFMDLVTIQKLLLIQLLIM